MRRDDATPPSSAQLVARLKASREALMDAIAGLDEEGFRSRPDASASSVAEILAHLYVVEQTASSGPHVNHADADARLAQRMPVPQILHGLLAGRRDTLRLIDQQSRNNTNLAAAFEGLAAHEEEHAQQIRALRGSLPAEMP